MRLLGILVGAIQPTHIQRLTNDGVGEGRTLDFKETLPGTTPEAKRDFLVDVTAMANTAGGVLVYGIRTVRDAENHDTGVADAIVGLGAANLDTESLRLQNMLHDGVSPSLRAQVRLQKVDLPGANGPVLVLGVPRSFLGPHRVSFNRVNRFWRRSEGGNYEPDVAELRQMFLETSTWIQEADAWRRDRVRRVRAGEVYPWTIPTPVVFVHVLPVGRLGQLVDLKDKTERIVTSLPPVHHPSGFSWRYNADGFMIYAAESSGQIISYSQVLRFGGVEGFDAGYVDAVPLTPGPGERLMLWAHELRRDLTAHIAAAIGVVHDICELEAPYAVLLGIYGVRGARIPVRDRNPLLAPATAIDVDDLVLPPVVLEEAGVDLGAALRPIFDVIWQAAGRSGAP